MKKTKLLAWAAVAAIGGLAMTSIASATAPVTVESNGDLTVCGIEYISNSWGAQWCITIQWKNVWATATWAWPSADLSSFWNYYQRWNNYWFSSNGSVTTSNEQIDCSTYNPLHPFSSSTFIISPNWSFYDYCISRNDNLWWWGDDNNGLVYPVENGSERRWPCDEWYHVPSQWEWYALMDMWAGSSVSWYIGDNIFYTDFQIPFAGRRSFGNGSRSAEGSDAYLWSSSPRVGNVHARSFHATAEFYDFRGHAYSVRCFKDSSVKPAEVQIVLSVNKWALRIWAEIWNVDLWEVNVSNSAQELSWSLWADSLWVEDMKWAESWYYTTISVSDLNWTVSGHSISANNVSLKTAWNEPSYISWAIVSDSKVVFSNDIKLWHNNWAEPVTYFNRQNTATADAWRVWKWWDNLQIKVNIPAHTPYDTYRWTITYTLYDNDL